MLMQEIEKLYQQNLNSIMGHDTDWLKNMRIELINKINVEGLPSKKKEIWKYSNLNHINEIRYNASKSSANINANNLDSIKLIDGHYYIPDKLGNNGVKIDSLGGSINNFKHYFLFDKNIFEQDFTIDMNTIFLTDGLTVLVNEGQSANLHIDYNDSADEITHYIRNFIKVSKNAKLKLVEEFSGTNSKSSFSNIFNNLWLENGSKVEHIIIENSSISSKLIYSSLNFCYENSKLNQISFQSGAQSVKTQHTTNLMGRDSLVNHHGIYFGKGTQFIDNKTTVIHHKENCKSKQIYKGVLSEDSNGVYLSNTFVKPEAQQTNGYQLSRGMLLSDKCTLKTKPELRIFADDVKCSHGSTVGAMNEEQLYYLRSRGINKKDAENLLIKSFYQDLLDIVTDTELKSKINVLVDAWLESY